MKIIKSTETKPLEITVGAPRTIAEWYEAAPQNVQKVYGMKGTKGHEDKYHEELGKLGADDLNWIRTIENLVREESGKKKSVGH